MMSSIRNIFSSIIRSPAACMAIILSISAILHIVFLIQFHKTPYSTLLMVDADIYHAKALSILENGWLGQVSSYQAPLYPYLIAAIYAVSGIDPLHVQIVQCLFSVANVFVIYLIGKKLFGARVGIVAGAIACLYAPFIYFAGILLKESLNVFFADCMLLFLISASGAPRAWKYAAGGVMLGVCISLRENFFLILPAIVLWIAFYAPSFRKKLGYSVIMLIGVAAILGPFAIKNSYYSKNLIFTSYQSGTNFYFGNGPQATGFFTPLDFARPNPVFEEADFKAETERILRRQLKPSEISRYWFFRALDGFREDPLHFPKLLAIKLALFLNSFEIPDNYDFNFMRAATPVLKFAPANFGIVMILALFGIWLSRGTSPKLQLMYAFMAVYTLSVLIFYVNSRFRMPLVPALIIFSAYSIVEGWKKIAAGGPKKIAISAGIFLALSAGIFSPYADIKDNFAVSYFKIGNSYENRGQLGEAANFFQKAIAVDPACARAIHHLGQVYERVGDSPRAIEKYHEALAIDECSIDALYSLAFAYDREGRREKAIDSFERVLSCREDHPPTHNNLGLLYAKAGEPAKAEMEIKRAIAISPYDADFHNNLGVLYLSRGLNDNARAEFSEALRIDPAHAGALQNMGTIKK